MSRDRIFYFAVHSAGLSEPSNPATLRKVNAMTSAGLLERRARTVRIPAMPEPFASHAPSMGLDPTEHDAEIVTYHLTEAGRAAWV